MPVGASSPFGGVVRSRVRAAREKRVSQLASLPIHGEPASRLCWSQLVSLATVFVSSRNAPPFAVCWGGALRDETKTVALNPGHMLGGERSHHCSTLDLMTDSSLP